MCDPPDHSGGLMKTLRIVAISASIFACSDFYSLEGYKISIDTDKPSYSKASDNSVTVTLKNEMDVSLYLPNSFATLQEYNENSWVDLGSWFVFEGISPSFAVPAGKSQVIDMDLGYIPRVPGTYRINFLLYHDQNLGALVLQEKRISNTFLVTE